MPNRLDEPERPGRAVCDRCGIPPPIPGTSRFVPLHIIADALSHVLALALHRDAWGNPRPGLSSRLLAAALRDGEVECDPLLVPWAPPPAGVGSVFNCAS